MSLLKGVGLDEEQLDRTARLTGNECGTGFMDVVVVLKFRFLSV